MTPGRGKGVDSPGGFCGANVSVSMQAPPTSPSLSIANKPGTTLSNAGLRRAGDPLHRVSGNALSSLRRAAVLRDPGRALTAAAGVWVRQSHTSLSIDKARRMLGYDPRHTHGVDPSIDALNG